MKREESGTEVVSVLAQRAAKANVRRLGAAKGGRVRMEVGPRWMRAMETTSMPDLGDEE